MPIQIQTDRLLLREMTQADFPALCQMLYDPVVMKAYEGAFTQAEAQAWLDQVGGQAVLGRQHVSPTPWLTERHGYDPTWRHPTVHLPPSPAWNRRWKSEAKRS